MATVTHCFIFIFLLQIVTCTCSSSSSSTAITLWTPGFEQIPSLPLTPSELVQRYKGESLSCEGDLAGTGSLETLCTLNHSVSLASESTLLAGDGSLAILPDAAISCASPGCSLTILLLGDLDVGASATIRSGSLWIQAANVNLGDGASLNSSAFGGKPPSGASGTPSGVDGAGAGHGGRGAYCLQDSKKEQRDLWGGDMYGWSTLMKPWFYGSSGGTTKKNADLGGKGGGRMNVTVTGILVVNGSIEADGGSVGEEGGGGSGGSLFVQASRIKGNGQISAIGGSGRGGASGGRIAISSMRIDGVTVRYHGGDSFACPRNNGASGTRYDIFSSSLRVSNGNKETATDTLLLEFPNHPLWSEVTVENNASVLVPLLWSRVQVRSMITLQSGGLLSFGLAWFSTSVFELVAEEVLMSDSTIKVYGALKLSVKMLLMWNSTIKIDGNPDDFMLAASTIETSNLVILRQKSVIESSANLGMHGQGLLKLSGPGDSLRAQRLFVSLFYTVHVAQGATMQAPLEVDSPIKEEIAKIYCESNVCPEEVLTPSEDCTLNVSSPFTMQICRVEDVHINGTVLGSAIHVQRVRTISIRGILSASALGCEGGLGKGGFEGGGGGHGGKGGEGCYRGSCAKGGRTYGSGELPCEFGSGSGSGNATHGDYTAGGGIVVMGSTEHPITKVEIFGVLSAEGETFNVSHREAGGGLGDPGGGSGGSLLLFLQTLIMGNGSILSSGGGHGGALGGGGGGGGRLHFHWSNIPTGVDFVPIAFVQGLYHTRGGLGGNWSSSQGEDGTVSGVDCPPGLHGIFCKECPVGTYKNDTGWEPELCKPCPPEKLPRRATYTYSRGGVVEAACPYQCISDKYHMPNCYTMVEDLIYTLGGPWWFTLLLSVVMVVLAMVLSVARMKLVGNDDFSGPAPTPHGALIDHSFPFLESLNEVLETTRVEESQNHIHRMYFMGANTFGEPWHLPHSPPEQIIDLVYEDAFNRFAEEINCLAAYQWWEGSVHSILSVLAYPVAWSWQQWRARKKIQRLREYVRSEYDHACLRSCRSRALYEGLKVAATPDLMLAYIDVFLGGDEKRPDLPPKLMHRLPMTIIFGGEGSYMAPYSLHSDNLLTSLIGQAVPSTMWYRLVAGLNAHLRTVRRGSLRSSLLPVMNWLNSTANPRLSTLGVRVDMAWHQATATGYYQLGLVVNPADEIPQPMQFPEEPSPSGSPRSVSYMPSDHEGRFNAPQQWQFSHGYSQLGVSSRRRIGGAVLDSSNIRALEDRRDFFVPVSLLLRNARPVGHHASVGLVISLLLLVDLSLTLLMLLQFYSVSLGAMLGILLVLPFASVIPAFAGLNALFSHGPRRSAALARIYALWNITSFVNLITAFIYGYIHYVLKIGAATSDLQGFTSEEESWWLFPAILVVVKAVQARMIDLHIANLEIQDRTLYSEDATRFWES